MSEPLPVSRISNLIPAQAQRLWSLDEAAARHRHLTGDAEAIPFAQLTKGSTERLYALKGEIVCRGIRSVLGVELPAYPKRRFQHGSVAPGAGARLFSGDEACYRRHFQALHATGV